MASNNPNPPPRGAWNSRRTFATQSEEAKREFALRAFESRVQITRMAFLTGRQTNLFGVCAGLGLKPTEPADRLITKDELTALTNLARHNLTHKPEPVAPAPAPTPAPTPIAPVSTTQAPEAPKEMEQIVEAPTGVHEYPLPELTDNKKVQPFGFQIRKTREMMHKVLVEKRRAILLLSGTGSGKTFMLGATICGLFREGFFADYKSPMWPVLYVTKASIVAQTEDVLYNLFKLDPRKVRVTNIEQLRATMGKIYIKEETVIVQGQEHIIFKWHKMTMPRLVIWDESQVLKNIDSTQSRIAQALNDANEFTHGPEATKTVQIFSSATPFMRLVETKCFAVATRANLEVS
jgi:hypothetical protein